jgi:endonuclease/exonuclease/phosphatase family metal-dependent hydrolase
MKRLQRIILITIAIITTMAYLSVLVPPTLFWPAVFFSYLIPGILCFHFILAIIFLFRRKRRTSPPRLAYFFLVGLAGGIPFILVSISIHGSESSEGSISLLSYNAKLFRQPKVYDQFSPELIHWVVEDPSDIKCIQEYSTDSLWRGLDITQQIRSKGYEGYAFKSKMAGNLHDLGIAIFSKYHIVNTGVVWEDTTSVNAAIYADIRIDTTMLRVYTVHLGSMNLDISQYKEFKYVRGKTKRLISKLKEGAVRRDNQIDRLIEHTQNCPYRFIICGDFNETPYSYNYFRLRNHFDNSFEEAGAGFGFSLNSKLFFLRIDHHFYSKGITPLRYRVDRSQKISDHFPTRATYVIE